MVTSDVRHQVLVGAPTFFPDKWFASGKSFAAPTVEIWYWVTQFCAYQWRSNTFLQWEQRRNIRFAALFIIQYCCRSKIMAEWYIWIASSLSEMSLEIRCSSFHGSLFASQKLHHDQGKVQNSTASNALEQNFCL